MILILITDTIIPLVSKRNDNILKSNTPEAFADNKMNVTKKWIFVLGMLENIVGKGENAGYQHFLLFPQCFQKPSFCRAVKTRDCLGKGYDKEEIDESFPTQS